MYYGIVIADIYWRREGLDTAGILFGGDFLTQPTLYGGISTQTTTSEK